MNSKLQNKVFSYYCDPSHGWLAVKKQDLIDLGVFDRITRYSYTRGKTVYLEEDLDMDIFCKAYYLKFNRMIKLNNKHTNKRSNIRNYENFFQR